MPARATLTPGGGEAGFTGFGPFPEREIEGVLFAGLFSTRDATSCVVLLFAQIAAAELAVTGMLHHGEVHITLSAVGRTFGFQFADEIADPIKALGGAGHAVGPQDPQGIHVLMEGLDVALAHGRHRGVLLIGAFEDLVVDVGEVLNEGHLEAPPDQISPQHIPVDVAAGMAQVAEVIDRDAAAIDARPCRASAV